MMECQICGDTQGPWEYEQYLSDQCVRCPEKELFCRKCSNDDEWDWKSWNGGVLLVCEDCANNLRKKIENRRKRK